MHFSIARSNPGSLSLCWPCSLLEFGKLWILNKLITVCGTKNLMLPSVGPCFFEQAQKNVVLEERVQVLQQQNEDLRARIESNLAMSRFTPICLFSS